MNGEVRDKGLEERPQDAGSTVCRDFLRKTCQRGRRCKFRHSVDAEGDESGQQKVCHDYQNKGCRRVSCRFVHCSREEEAEFRELGKLPQAVQPTAFVLPRIHQEGSYVMMQKHPHQMMRLEPPVKRQRFSNFSDEEEARFANLHHENFDLRRMVDELRHQVDSLAATNEVLLEQNARLRLNPQTAAVVSLPAVTISTNSADGPPVTIAASVTPCSVTQVSLATAGISIAPPVVTVAQTITASSPSSGTQTVTITGTTSALVPYPIVTHHVLRPAL